MSDRSVHVIVRTAGERTLGAARNLLAEQVDTAMVDVVAERPFERALRRTFELGIERRARWTMTLDADVLLRRGAVGELLQAAEQQSEDVVQVEGRVYDKLTGEVRCAGHRMYRTRHLPAALRNLPEIGAEIRPEYVTLQRLELEGLRSRTVDCVAGLHDFEQYFADIYRKSFVHANKHTGILSEMIVRAKTLAGSDPDFRVVLKGLYDGLLTSKSVAIDADAHLQRIPSILAELDLREKPSLNPALIGSEYVERELNDHIIPAVSLWGKFCHDSRSSGVMRMVPRLTGAGLFRLGRCLAGWGERIYARGARKETLAGRK